MYLIVLFVVAYFNYALCDPIEFTLDISKPLDMGLLFMTRYHRFPLDTLMVNVRPGKCLDRIVSGEDVVWKADQDQCIRDLWIYERNDTFLMFDLTIITNKTEREIRHFINLGEGWRKTTYDCFHGILHILKAHKLAINDFTSINSRVFEGGTPEEALKEILLERCLPKKQPSKDLNESNPEDTAWYYKVCTCCLSATD